MSRAEDLGRAGVDAIAPAVDEVEQLRNRCAELERANRAKDHMLAILGHDLRAPLNAILGWTSRLQTAELDEEGRARALDTIERNARTQQRLIEQILEASRVAADRLKLTLAPIDLGPVVEHVVEGFLPAAAERRIELSFVACDGVYILADRERIEQVVTNLVDNALKHAEAGGHVAVTAKRDRGQGVLSVKDDGQGIATELLPRVFDLYVQDGAAKMARSGLGLGLHIVKTIVERHGGVVTAESEGSGKGATFTACFALHEGSASGTRPKTIA